MWRIIGVFYYFGITISEETCHGEEVGALIMTRGSDTLVGELDADADADADADGAITEAVAAGIVDEGAMFPQWKLKEFFEAQKRNMSQVSLRRLYQTQKNCHSERGPQHVLVAAGPRTGSTSLMSIAHSLLFFCDAQYEPVRDSHPFADHQTNFPWAAFTGKHSSILKVHEAPNREVKQYPTVVLTAHRRPDVQLASIWTHWYKNQPCAHPPCRGWTTAQRELERQACLHETFGKKIKYDMALEKLAEDPIFVVKKVAQALGMTLDDTLAEHALKMYDKARRSIRVSDQKRENVFIQEISDENEEMDSGAATVAFQQSVTYAIDLGEKTIKLETWLDGNGTITSNPLWLTQQHRMDSKLKTWTNWEWCRGWKALNSGR